MKGTMPQVCHHRHSLTGQQPVSPRFSAARPISWPGKSRQTVLTSASFAPVNLRECAKPLAGALAGFAATAALLLVQPAFADIQTVASDQIVASAKPLKLSQRVNKEKVWLVIILGASSLYGATVILENNEKFFPAISKANRAMRATTKKSGQEVPEEVIEAYVNEDSEDRLQRAVLEGLSSARERTPVPPPLLTQWGSAEANSDDERSERRPKFEITADQIAESEAQRDRALEQMSLEQIERELQARKQGNESN